MGIFSRFRSRLERETEEERQKLEEILKDVKDPQSESKLRDLALRIGASTKARSDFGHSRSAFEPELIENIHLALQTKAMIAAVKTTSNYVIVTIILALIAFAGMVANFIMAFRVN